MEKSVRSNGPSEQLASFDLSGLFFMSLTRKNGRGPSWMLSSCLRSRRCSSACSAGARVADAARAAARQSDTTNFCIDSSSSVMVRAKRVDAACCDSATAVCQLNDKFSDVLDPTASTGASIQIEHHREQSVCGARRHHQRQLELQERLEP